MRNVLHQPTVEVTDDASVRRRPRAVAIGVFDGVHIGHAQVIAGCDTVLTFDPHPLQVLRPDDVPALLTTVPTKVARLAALGVREVVVLRFDARWAAVAAPSFVDDLLVGRLGAHTVSVGANFRFGAGGEGSGHVLRRDGRFRTRVTPLVRSAAGVVSSSRIRASLSSGDIGAVTRLLGRPHALTGRGAPGRSVVVDTGLAVPPAGRYRVLVNDVPTHAVVDDRGRITVDEQLRGRVELVLRCRVDR
ncbi:FAD synthetase [Pseudonocardia benzenivorans]|uniref:FAD synthase n=1 Tax=Pseudonocardia benzenivorans TaxID=228005 RepID=A0ABW3VRF5_9PSEU